LQPRRRAFELPSIESALSQYGTRRPSHRGTHARCVSRPLPCPLPSTEAPLPRAHWQPRVRRGARRKPFSLGGLITHLRAELAAASCDSAVAHRLAHRHALPHRAQRLQRATHRLRASALALGALGLDRQRQGRAPRLAVAGVRRRSTRSCVSRMPAGAMRSAGRVCALCRAPGRTLTVHSASSGHVSDHVIIGA
jgi:hypothetical protein